MDQVNLSSSKLFETCCSQEQGKYAKATRDIEINEVILEEQPLIVGPSMEPILRGPFPCVGCCKLIPNEESSYKCLCCGWPSCSSSCPGLKEANRHGLECRILKNGLKRGVRTFYQYFRFDVLTIIRTLCLQLDKEKWNQLLCLEDHLHQIDPASPKFKEMTEKTTFIVDNFIEPLKEYEEENQDETLLQEKSTTLINKIWALIVTNSFSMPPNVVILYKSVNTFEQSCLPNTTQSINNCDFILRAVKPIARGDHITLMYTSVLLGTISRRRELRGKFLKCFCARCKDPSELGTFFGALKCVGSKKPCGGIQIPLKPLEENTEWLCSKCKIRLPNEDVMKFVDHLGDEVDKVLGNKPLIHELKILLKKLKKFLHQNHYHVFRVSLALVKLQDSDDTGTDNKDLEIVKTTIKSCSHLIRLIKKLDPGLSRLSMDLSNLLLILFNAKWCLMKSTFSKDSKEGCLNEVNLLKSTLEDAKRIIMEDRGRELLLERIREKEIIFNNWLKDNDFA